ncbi:MAG TPA: hypothetical protein VGO49_04480 [Bradyrhizobium sp.]|nr:hypothetical protein [Bradyrhizobium sp.]
MLSLDALAIDDYLERRGSIMATMISEVYDAFIASGAPEDKARKAAEAMAAYEGRFNGIEGDLGMIQGDMHMIRGDINVIRGDVNLLKWMNGITWALCFGILFKLFLH